jgi:hypothetical protein
MDPIEKSMRTAVLFFVCAKAGDMTMESVEYKVSKFPITEDKIAIARAIADSLKDYYSSHDLVDRIVRAVAQTPWHPQ